MLRVRHSRHQWAVGHGFFHTASVSINRNRFCYVYDCGTQASVELINNNVDQFCKNEKTAVISDSAKKTEIDMVVISHFHVDHMKGIPHLMKHFHIRRLVIPYLSQDSQIVALFQLASMAFENQETWKSLSLLVVDSENWAKGFGSDTEIIRVKHEEGGNQTQPLQNDNGWSIPSKAGSMSDADQITVFNTKCPVWAFKFYCSEDSTNTNQLLKALAKAFPDLPKGEQLIKIMLANLQDDNWIHTNWEKLKGCFKTISKNPNTTSLSMFSGPDLHYIVDLSFQLNLPRWNFFSLLSRDQHRCIGWLGTADAKLKGDMKFSMFEKHFGHLLEYVDTVTIPHHGSREDFNPRLADVGSRQVITSDYSIDPKNNHPASEVIQSILANHGQPHIVTMDIKTELVEQYDIRFNWDTI